MNKLTRSLRAVGVCCFSFSLMARASIRLSEPNWNDCAGEIEREYSVEWDSETGDMTKQKKGSCIIDSPNPVTELDPPTQEELKEARKK